MGWVEEQLKLQQELQEKRLKEALEVICQKVDKFTKKQETSLQKELENLKEQQHKTLDEIRQEQSQSMNTQLQRFQELVKSNFQIVKKKQQELQQQDSDKLARTREQFEERIAKLPNPRTFTEHLTKCQLYHKKIDKQSEEIKTLKQALEASKSDLQSWKEQQEKDHQDIGKLMKDYQASQNRSECMHTPLEKIDDAFSQLLKGKPCKESGEKQKVDDDDSTPVPIDPPKPNTKPPKPSTERWLQTVDSSTKATQSDQEHHKSAGKVQERFLDVSNLCLGGAKAFFDPFGKDNFPVTKTTNLMFLFYCCWLWVKT